MFKIFTNKIIKNAGWLMLGRVIHIVFSFLVSLLTARYLGPSNYGVINYASAYATFFSSFCTLGINSVIIKNFIDNPLDEGETIGTTLLLRLVSSLLSVVVIFVLVSIIDKGEYITIIIVTMYSLSLVFHIFDTFNYWFQSKLLSKYYAMSTLVSYISVSIYKIYLLANQKSVYWFAISNSLDYLIVAFLVFFFYKRCNGPTLSFSWRKAKELLSVSYNYILSGLMIAIYASVDKIMIKQLVDESAVAYYSLAVSISTMWTFILSAIIDSMKPSIMKYFNDDKNKYIHMNKQMYAIVFYISFIASLFITVVAPLFINFIYGEEYLLAVSPLRIVVWYVSFSYLGVARDAWIVCESKQKYLKYIYLGSAVINIFLNFSLIPVLGINGAAVATLLTQMSTIFICPLFFKELRPNVKLIAEAILFKNIL